MPPTAPLARPSSPVTDHTPGILLMLLGFIAVLVIIGLTVGGCAADPMPRADFSVSDPQTGEEVVRSDTSAPDNTVTLTDGGYFSKQNQPMTGSDLVQAGAGGERTGMSYIGPGPSTLFNWRILGIQGASHTDIGASGLELTFDPERNPDGLTSIKVASLSSGASAVIEAETGRLAEAVKWYMHATTEQRVAWVEQQKTIGGVAATIADAVIKIAAAAAPVPVP